MSFYDEIADEYDEITGLAGRVAQAEAFIKELGSRHPIASVLDIACGTGLYAILMAKAGIEAVGVDISQSMLDKAGQHAGEAAVTVQWTQASMQEVAARLDRQFDAVLCMGNSIPHLLDDDSLDAAIGGFVKMLRPGGVVAIQVLNYARILARAERIVEINRAADREYVRFCDFLGDTVRFNILEITWQGDRCEHRLHSSILRPYRADELSACLKVHGADNVTVYSGLGLERFEPAQSDTAVIVGTKQ
jgi:ubiquinone/menaquinone biosynthesis C-methylase UbiE